MKEWLLHESITEEFETKPREEKRLILSAEQERQSAHNARRLDYLATYSMKALKCQTLVYLANMYNRYACTMKLICIYITCTYQACLECCYLLEVAK